MLHAIHQCGQARHPQGHVSDARRLRRGRTALDDLKPQVVPHRFTVTWSNDLGVKNAYGQAVVTRQIGVLTLFKRTQRASYSHHLHTI